MLEQGGHLQDDGPQWDQGCTALLVPPAGSPTMIWVLLERLELRIPYPRSSFLITIRRKLSFSSSCLETQDTSHTHTHSVTEDRVTL